MDFNHRPSASQADALYRLSYTSMAENQGFAFRVSGFKWVNLKPGTRNSELETQSAAIPVRRLFQMEEGRGIEPQGFKSLRGFQDRLSPWMLPSQTFSIADCGLPVLVSRSEFQVSSA